MAVSLQEEPKEPASIRQLQEEEESQAAAAEFIEREAPAANATAVTRQSYQQASPRSSPSGQSLKKYEVSYLIYLLLLSTIFRNNLLIICCRMPLLSGRAWST